MKGIFISVCRIVIVPGWLKVKFSIEMPESFVDHSFFQNPIAVNRNIGFRKVV